MYDPSLLFVSTNCLAQCWKWKSELCICPNPTRYELIIEGITGTAEIFSTNGECMMRTVSKKIDVSGLQNGIYLLKVNNGARTEIRKIVKE